MDISATTGSGLLMGGRRKGIALLLLGAGTVLALLLHTFHPPSRELISSFRPSSFLPNAATSGFSTHSSPCNPYDQLGHLSISRSQPFSNRWIPYRIDCPAPALMASLVRDAWDTQLPDDDTIAHNPLEASSEQGSWRHEALDPLGRQWEDVSWARNRTIMVIGDSLGRENVGFFCQLLGEKMFEINYKHPWHPSDVRKELQKRLPSHHSHACYVPSIDFLILQVFTFGLDVDGYWSAREPLAVPYPYEERMAQLARPYIHAARDMDVEPDVVYLASAMWDLAKWKEEDGVAGRDAEEGLDTDRLEWYRTRVRSVLGKAQEVFPSSHLSWLTNHYPIVDRTKAFFDKPHATNRLIRMHQLNQAAESAVVDSPDLAAVGMMRWGELMIGTEKYQRDELHHLLFPGGYLWSDMMLYDLREAVYSKASVGWWSGMRRLVR